MANDTVKKLILMLGLFSAGISAQLQTDPKGAMKIAEEIVGTQYDYMEACKKVEEAKKQNANSVTIKGYTFKKG